MFIKRHLWVAKMTVIFVQKSLDDCSKIALKKQIFNLKVKVRICYEKCGKWGCLKRLHRRETQPDRRAFSQL